MAQRRALLTFKSVNMTKALALSIAGLLLSQLHLRAQSPYLYLITFQGVCYQKNSSGNLAPVPLTQQTFLQDVAQAGGVDPKTLVLVYHIQGSGLGDTIDVVNASTGSTLVNLFGLYFGDTLGRTAATNATATVVRRVDYIYTQQNYTYTSWNPDAMGAAFTTKRFQTDAQGNVRTTVDAQMHWIVNPQGNASTKICSGSFTTTKPFTPH